MAALDTDVCWYAAYGSNLDATRFGCYVAGGRPPGARRSYGGCRDQSPPVTSVGIRLPYPMYFAQHSSVWAGGVAFVDPVAVDPAPTLGRAYLITAEQMADIAAQENGGRAGDQPPMSLERLEDGDRVELEGGWYGMLVCCGARDGIPVVTLTAASRRDPGPVTRPSAAYLTVMARGLRDAHGLDVERIVDYLHTCAGEQACPKDALRATVQAALAGFP